MIRREQYNHIMFTIGPGSNNCGYVEIYEDVYHTNITNDMCKQHLFR